jgi:mono/diheme cytochrome c family protein
MLRRIALPFLFSLTAAQFAHGTDAATLWSTKVQPLFDVNCVKCHGPLEQKSGLELDTPQAALKGSEDGPVIVPGKPEESALWQNLAAKADPHMPPKKQFTDAERDVVREWIAALTAAPAVVAKPRVERHFESIPQAVDTLISEGWQERNVQPAPATDERTWCRRVYLDLAGRIPTAAEVEEFLNAPAETKRATLVDRLLESKEYATHMRELWDVFLMGRGKRDGSENRRKQAGWWDFLEASFRTNRPWNETVHAIITGRADKPEDKGSPWFLFERKDDFQRIAEAVAPVVYGTKIDCAQCHDHPLAREIKQGHYWGLVTAFNRGKNIEGTNNVSESAIGGYPNFTNLKKESQPAVVMLLTGRTLAENWPAGDQKETDSDDKYVDAKAKVRVPKYSRREAFADAATTDNPLLARAFVNRMWAALTGRGIVNPADEMNGRNAPSHPELLDWLAQDFASHNYDTRRFMRGIVLSRVYGLQPSTATSPEAFAGALERPLMGEQIARSWRVAAGLPPADEGLRHAVVMALPDVLPKAYNATFQQAQFLSNAPALAELVKPASENAAAKIVALPDTAARVRQAFLDVYGRTPDAEEATQAAAFLDARADKPAEAARDLLWALMTSAEFLTMP